MIRTVGIETLWTEIERRLGITQGEAHEWSHATLAEWQSIARHDSSGATYLAVLVARMHYPKPLRVATANPAPECSRIEANYVRRLTEDFAKGEALSEAYRQLRLACPYPASARARLEALELIKLPNALSDDLRMMTLDLARFLADQPPQVVAQSRLPRDLWRRGDGAYVETKIISERLISASDMTLKGVTSDLLPNGLEELVDYYGVRILRRFASSGKLASSIVITGLADLHARPRWAELLSAWNLLDLAGIPGEEADPFQAHPDLIARVVFGEDQAEATEVELDIRLADEFIDGITKPAELRNAWNRSLRGFGVLKELLIAARRRGADVVFPHLPTRPKAIRQDQTEPDDAQLDWESLVEVVAFGLRVLLDEGKRELVCAWVLAWSGALRPRETAPCREDLVPMGGGYLIYLDRRTSKVGRRLAYIPPRAVEATRLSPSIFPKRQRGCELPEEYLAEAAERLRTSCRLVRAAWAAEGHGELPDRVAYLCRKLAADAVRWTAAGRSWTITTILGHFGPVNDASYIQVSQSELQTMHAMLGTELDQKIKSVVGQ